MSEPKQEQGYSPLLNENVQEKQYSANGVAAAAEPIPEPQFMPPSFSGQSDFFETEDDGKPDKNKTQAQQQQPKPVHTDKAHADAGPIDPSFNEMSLKEKRRAAEALASSFFQGYGLLCHHGAKWFMIKQRTVDKLIREGKIDTSELFWAPGGVQATAQDIIASYNGEMHGIMELSPEVVEEAKPILVRICMKRGLGMSDEAQFAWIMGQDLVMKMGMMISIRNTSREFLKSFTKANSIQHAPASESIPQPQPQDKVQGEPVREPVPVDPIETITEIKETAPAPTNPALSENAPGNFFDPVGSGKQNLPEFGNEDVLNKIDEIAGTKSPKRRPYKKRRK